MNSPGLLLLITGTLLGLNFPLGKLASTAMIPPVVWAFLVSAGAAMGLLLAQLVTGKGARINRSYINYYVLSSLVSLVIPNLLIYTVIQKLGSGFTSLLFTLSPVITLMISVALRMTVPSKTGILGIIIAFTGAVMVTTTRGEATSPAAWSWLILGLCIPLSLALGNVYRTIKWPKNAKPIELAIGSNISAALLLLLATVSTTGFTSITTLASAPLLTVVQIIASALMFSTFFRLQQLGGPTYLSQIGYIAAGVALVIGTLVLDEIYALITWTGAAIILLGIVLSIVGQQSNTKG